MNAYRAVFDLQWILAAPLPDSRPSLHVSNQVSLHVHVLSLVPEISEIIIDRENSYAFFFRNICPQNVTLSICFWGIPNSSPDMGFCRLEIARYLRILVLIRTPLEFIIHLHLLFLSYLIIFPPKE